MLGLVPGLRLNALDEEQEALANLAMHDSGLAKALVGTCIEMGKESDMEQR